MDGLGRAKQDARAESNAGAVAEDAQERQCSAKSRPEVRASALTSSGPFPLLQILLQLCNQVFKHRDRVINRLRRGHVNTRFLQ